MQPCPPTSTIDIQKTQKTASLALCAHLRGLSGGQSGDGLLRCIAMASDIFAKIGDIKGESLDSKHKDEIEVLTR